MKVPTLGGRLTLTRKTRCILVMRRPGFVAWFDTSGSCSGIHDKAERCGLGDIVFPSGLPTLPHADRPTLEDHIETLTATLFW